MNKKVATIIIVLGISVLLSFFIFNNKKEEPITYTSSGTYRSLSLDEIINESELIVIGKVKTKLPSLWMSPGGKDITNASPREIFEARGLFTDSLVSVDQIIKGENKWEIIRVRSFVGETDQVRWVDETQPSYKQEQVYLLLLEGDNGPAAQIDPGYYTTVNGLQGVYEIIDGRAISAVDEWDLEELMAYIEKSLSNEMLSPTLPPISCGQAVSRPFLPNSEGNPLGSGDEVSIEDAQSRIFYPIPLPELEDVERVWIRTNPENPSDQSVAVCFKRDLLLIIHKSEKAPDWDEVIANEPLFKKINVNGNPGMGANPGVAEVQGQSYAYPGSVGWWIDGLNITLYSDTLSLEELLKIAETVHLAKTLLMPTETRFVKVM